MDPLDLVRRIAAVERRGAGSDAERRAARLLATELRGLGRRSTRIQTFWVRPHWAALHALVCAVAIAGSVVSVDHPVLGVSLAGAALLVLVLDLTGRVPVLRRITPEHATQNVVAPDPRRDLKVRLVLTASIDAPRAGVIERGRVARTGVRLRAALRGHLPGLHGWLLFALVAVTACTGARVAADDAPEWLGPVQLVPTVLMLVALAVCIDAATTNVARFGANADATGAAAVVAVLTALERRPPQNLGVDVVLAGAGGPHALGMRRWVRDRRKAGAKAEEVAVLHIGSCGSGRPAWWTRDGLVLPLRYHPRLVALAESTAAAERHLGARAHQSRGTSGARAARAARWPAIAIGALDDTGTVPHRGTDTDTIDRVDGDAIAATVAFALGLIAALDADLA